MFPRIPNPFDSHISEEEYKIRMERIKRENEAKERHRMLREERRKGQPQWKLPATSKLVLFGVIALCVEIVLFCEYAMLKLYDTSSMYVLIGIPVALAPTIWGYYSKSKAENTAGGIVYDAAMMGMNIASEVVDEVMNEEVSEATSVTDDDESLGVDITDNSEGKG